MNTNKPDIEQKAIPTIELKVIIFLGDGDTEAMLARQIISHLHRDDRNILIVPFEKERKLTENKAPVLRWVKAITDRIAELMLAEKSALIDIDGVPVGSHARKISWDFIKELGYRKNELQDLLRKMEAEEIPCPEADLPSNVGDATKPSSDVSDMNVGDMPQIRAKEGASQDRIPEEIMKWIRETENQFEIGGPEQYGCRVGLVAMYRHLQSQLSAITAESDAAIIQRDEFKKDLQKIGTDLYDALKEIEELKSHVRIAYFDGFNQAHYSHLHPDVCPPKEIEQAADEYFATKYKKEEPKQ